LRCCAASSPRSGPGSLYQPWGCLAARSRRRAPIPSLRKRYLPCTAQGRYRFKE
jgi:hypothetical protein